MSSFFLIYISRRLFCVVLVDAVELRKHSVNLLVVATIKLWALLRSWCQVCRCGLPDLISTQSNHIPTLSLRTVNCISSWIPWHQCKVIRILLATVRLTKRSLKISILLKVNSSFQNLRISLAIISCWIHHTSTSQRQRTGLNNRKLSKQLIITINWFHFLWDLDCFLIIYFPWSDGLSGVPNITLFLCLFCWCIITLCQLAWRLPH